MPHFFIFFINTSITVISRLYCYVNYQKALQKLKIFSQKAAKSPTQVYHPMKFTQIILSVINCTEDMSQGISWNAS